MRTLYIYNTEQEKSLMVNLLLYKWEKYTVMAEGEGRRHFGSTAAGMGERELDEKARYQLY